MIQNLQAQPPAAPAATSLAAHVNILDTFESTNPFDLGSRAGPYAFPKSSSPLDNSWDGTIEQLTLLIISLRVRASEVHWNAPAPQGILDISGTNLLTVYQSLIQFQIETTSTARNQPRDIHNALAMYS